MSSTLFFDGVTGGTFCQLFLLIFLMAGKAVGMASTFQGIKLFITSFFAGKNFVIMASFTFLNFLPFYVRNLFAVFHVVMTFGAGKGILMFFMGKSNRLFASFIDYQLLRSFVGGKSSGNSTTNKEGGYDSACEYFL